MATFKKIKANSNSIAQRKLVWGVGTNDAWYMITQIINGKTIMCPIYKRWKSILRRCYNPMCQSRHPTYKECTVCDEWLTFSVFAEWMEKQKWQGKHIDKDIRIIGNKIYSPETCCFVSQRINNLLTNSAGSRGNFPIGVCFIKRENKFSAYCRVYNKQKFLGYFTTSDEASAAYKFAKYNEIVRLAKMPENAFIANGLFAQAANVAKMKGTNQ